ncbi:MAG: DUF2510 domain-containing protein, partial [Acidimicrobiales bacterium]
MNSPAPGWLPDPTTRHQYRYWDGTRWTDDVADGGVASTDVLGDPSPAASGPNPMGGPTYPPGADPTQQVDATRQYPGAGEQPTAPTPDYGDHYGTGQAPPGPAKKRPPAGLIAALAVLAVALIGGLVYFLVRDDDDGSSDNASEIIDEDSTTTEPDNPDDGDNNDNSNSAGGDEGGSGDTPLPDDIDSENVDQLVEIMADNMEQASGGAVSHEEATCISEGFLDELGLGRLLELGESDENPFTDPEMTSQLFSIMEDCGVSLEDLAT